MPDKKRIDNQKLREYGALWKFFDDEHKPVANFLVKVIHLKKIQYPDHIDKIILAKIYFTKKICIRVEIPLDELDRFDWTKCDERCVINKQRRTARAYLNDYIRRHLCGAPVRNMTGIEHQGLHLVDGHAVFLAGDKLITPEGHDDLSNKIKVNPCDFRLDIDTELSPKDAFSGMMELMSLNCEIGQVLVAHTISGLIRQAYKEIGYIPCAVLVVVGKSGMFKTHYIAHMVQLYNRNDEIKPVTRLNSTSRFIEDILYEYAECTAVIDDLHTGSSSTIKRNNENTAEEIIRRISDDTGRGIKSGNSLVQKSFRGNAILIGEYFNGKGSTVPRALYANITEKIDGRILDEYQRHKKLVVSTFYYYFLQWYVNNYHQICSELDRELTKHRQTDYESKLHSRLLDTMFYLTASYNLFLQFCKESGFITDEQANIGKSSFAAQVCRLCIEQQNRYALPNTDYLSLISKAYKKGRFKIAKDTTSFDENKHDGVIHYNCLCLYSKRFDSVMSDIIPNYDHKDLVDTLKKEGALKIHSSDGKNDVKICGLKKRFFAIPLHKLKGTDI